MGTLLFTLVLGALFLVVAAGAAFGIVSMLRENRRKAAHLESSGEEVPLLLDHLSGPLRRLVQDARTLRISLEGPIRDVALLREGAFVETAGETLADFDSMLMNLSRDVVDWIDAAQRLPEVDRSRLDDLGVPALAFRNLLLAEGGAFERKNLAPPGAPPLDHRLVRLSDELRRFEWVVQGASSRGYR